MRRHSPPLPQLRSRHGQGMSEYIIIVMMVAIGSLFVVTLFGRKISKLFSAATQSLDAGRPIQSKSGGSASTDFHLGEMDPNAENPLGGGLPAPEPAGE